MRIRYMVAGLLAAGMVAVLQAQPGGGFGGRFGGGSSPTRLVANKSVQEDLKLSEDQVKKLADWGKEFQTKRAEIMKEKGVDFGGPGKGGAGGFKIDEETMAKMAAATAAVNTEAYKQLGDILKKEQIDRLRQIARQDMGLNAFSDADTATALKLTDSQKTSVKGLTGDFQKESREIRAEAGKGGGNKGKGGFGGFNPETQKKIAKVEKEYVGKAVDLLTDTQKKSWKELIGTEFDLTKLQGGGFTPKKKD